MQDLFDENEERKYEIQRRQKLFGAPSGAVKKSGGGSLSRDKIPEVVINPEDIFTPVRTKQIQDMGKVPGVDEIIFYQGGKVLKPEDAYKNMGFGTYIATLFRLYHDKVGYESADLGMFSTVAQEAIRLYGPDVNISDNVVAAASFHMEVNDISPYHALRDARSSIKDNAPRTVYADMIVSGETGMTVDTTTGLVAVAQDPGLTKRATKCMGPLFQAKESPKMEMASVICDLTDTNLSFVGELEEEVVRWVKDGNVPEIKETNPFRSLTSVPGLMSTAPVAPGNHGHLQGVYKLLRAIEKDKPDVLIVPGYNQALAGSYKSLDDCSRVIPLPDDLMHASQALASISVENFDDVIMGLRSAEKEFEVNPMLKHNNKTNARAYYHAQFDEFYTRCREESHGVSPIKVRYVSLFRFKPVTAQELVVLSQDGYCDSYPMLMRAGEYHLATLKGVNGSFVLTDPVAMLGVFMSRSYVKNYINPKFINEKEKVKSAVGFYSLKDISTGAVNNYSSWIQKYVLAKLADVLFPTKGLGKKLLKDYLANATGGKDGRSASSAKSLLRELIGCYGSINPSQDKILVLTPSYSMKKALKHTSMMMENGPLDRMVREVKAVIEAPPEDPNDEEMFGSGDQNSDDDFDPSFGVNLEDPSSKEPEEEQFASVFNEDSL